MVNGSWNKTEAEGFTIRSGARGKTRSGAGTMRKRVLRVSSPAVVRIPILRDTTTLWWGTLTVCLVPCVPEEMIAQLDGLQISVKTTKNNTIFLWNPFGAAAVVAVLIHTTPLYIALYNLSFRSVLRPFLLKLLFVRSACSSSTFNLLISSFLINTNMFSVLSVTLLFLTSSSNFHKQY